MSDDGDHDRIETPVVSIETTAPPTEATLLVKQAGGLVKVGVQSETVRGALFLEPDEVDDLVEDLLSAVKSADEYKHPEADK